MPIPVGVKAKLRWADRHQKSLVDMGADFSKGDTYNIVPERNPEQTEIGIRVLLTDPLPTEDWALTTGDCIHSLRSALDHLIFAIAIKQSGTNPPPGATTLMFPIGATPDDFRHKRWRLQDLRKDDALMTEIKMLQPYNRPEQSGLRPLALLEDFDTADKHRLLPVVIAWHQGSTFNIVGDLPPGTHGQMHVTVGPLEHNAEVFRFTADRPIPNVNVQANLQVEVSLGHTSASNDGRTRSIVGWVLDTLRTEVNHVIATLEPFT